MNQLIKIKQNESNEQLVSGRDLHEFLGVKSRFNDWIKNRVEKYGFEENMDFTTLTKNLVNGGKETDYILKLSMAKELSMVENNDKGKQARRYFIECEKKLKEVVQTTQQQRLYERSPQELLADNAIALNKMFVTLGLNIPKEIIVSSAITGTKNAVGYSFPEVQELLNKQEEEAYHTKSEVCKRVGIKGNKVNLALSMLGLQDEGLTTMQPWILTDLGKEYGVERSYTNGAYQGYEIKLKESAIEYIKSRLDELPKDMLKK